MPQDNAIVFADLKGSTVSELSFISDILKTVDTLPAAIDQNTWGDAYFAAFGSSVDAVRHALKVRDALRYCDWRAIGLDSQPKLRTAIAIGPVSWKQDAIDNLRERLTGQVFVEAARIEPIVAAGEVWVTSAVKDTANNMKSPEFYFEELGNITLPKHFGALPAFRAQWSKDRSWLEKGIRLPLDDEQYRGRANALRRFALLWLLLDQLPIGSWGRSTTNWMNAVWQDIPSIPPNPIMEDEGGFESTILNLQLLFELFSNIPDIFRSSNVCKAAYHYLEHRYNTQGFGTLGMERQGAEIEPRPRHTALAAWLFGTVAKTHSLGEAKTKELFKSACLALFAGDPDRTEKQFLNDRHPLMLFLAAGHVVRQLDSIDWKELLTDDEMKRVKATWAHCEGRLLLKAVESDYQTDASGPRHLIEQRGYPSPIPVPYGGFVRMEIYSLLSASLLCDAETASDVKRAIARSINEIARQYLISFGSPESRYSRDPLRPFSSDNKGLPIYRGIPPHLAGEVSPDLGCTALLYRALRNPALRDAVHSEWRNIVGIDQTRFFLEEDLIHEFDRYLVAPQLFSLSHAGMLAALLSGDHPSLVKSVGKGLDVYLNDSRTALDLSERTLKAVPSEKFLVETVENLVCTDPRIDPPTLQLSTISLVRLLVDRVRPGRYSRERNLSRSAIQVICRDTANVYSDEAFLRKYDYTWSNAVDESILRPFLAMLQPKSTILDLGCGPGHYAKEFQNAGHVVDLLDCSQPALDIAQKKLDPLGCPRNVFLGDITQASFRGRVPIGARYDGIWCSGVMVHIPSTAWPEILLWIRSLLAPAGALFVNVMIDNPCLFARDGRYFTYLRSATEFEQTLVKAGFDVSHYLSKNIARNTYGEPLIQRSWANFYAKPSGASDSDFGSVAATMTGLAYERSFKAFASCHLGQDRQRFIEAELAVLLEYLKNPVGRRILDLGCGTGDFLKALANEGYTAVGVDISEQMIGLSKSQTADVRTGSVTLELCDMCELPRNWTSTFDAALCITALQHQPIIGGRFDKALSELYRVLKPGGIARIDSRIGLDSGFDPDLRYIQAFSNKQEVIEHIHRAGFELATIPEPHSWTLPARQNSFRRDIDLSFVEFWLRKRTRD